MKTVPTFMRYTVNQLATLAHVSVRTLHYYDEVGLLKPSYIAKNGYRYYEDKELICLQQILFFRELEFALDDIKRMMSRPNFKVAEALRAQKKLVQLKRTRLDGLVKAIDKTLRAMSDNEKLEEEEMYDAFKDDDVKQYQEEVKERWGSTNAYKESMQRVGKMTKQEMNKMKEDGKKFTQELAGSADKPVESPEAQALIQKHYDGVNFFYTCPLDVYRNLGKMYVDDTRFTAYYDGFRPGLAVWLRDAIAYYCDQREQQA